MTEEISKIKSEYLVMDEYGYTDKELVNTVNMLVDKVNELNALIQHKSRKRGRKMTNLEKVLEVDGDRFIQEIAEKICFSTCFHTVKDVTPVLCGDCEFGEQKCSGAWKCHTEEIIEWLKAECEDEE